jgi:hypothetical protein
MPNVLLFTFVFFLQGGFCAPLLFLTDRKQGADGKAYGCTDSGTSFICLDAFTESRKTKTPSAKEERRSFHPSFTHGVDCLQVDDPFYVLVMSMIAA